MTTTTTFTVVGMTCDHCVRAVRQEIAGIAGVTEIEVNLTSGLVSVESTEPIDDKAIAAAVDEAGYEVAS